MNGLMVIRKHSFHIAQGIVAVILNHLALVPVAHASPVGGQIINGSGTINQSGLTTTIHQSAQTQIINWNSYNLKSNEIVNYIQPNASAISLNRILDLSPSQIDGTINANGRIVLVNPNGVFFGSNASINVGGLIASGLDIDPNRFLNGNYLFNSVDDSEGAVINSGTLNASLGGSITLLGQQVENRGLINAQLGSVNLAAGKQAIVSFDSDGLVGIKITEAVLKSDIGVDPAVINSGEIQAQGGQILMTGSQSQALFSQAVNTGDISQANSVVIHEDGSFTLGAGANVENSGSLDVSGRGNQNAGQIAVLGENIENSGTLKADSYEGAAGFIELHAQDKTELTNTAKISAKATKSGKGGRVQILGDKVGLFDHAEINADGANGGGQILIGGDQLGNNESIRNAEFLFMGNDTQVNANATDNGDGGKVITYADDTARIYGALAAKGGVKGGDGGFVETSGKQGFEIASSPDVSAPIGDGGLWLIDPYDIEIVSGSSSSNINTASSPYTSTGSATLDVSDILTGLSGGDVSIVAGGTVGDGNGNGDILISASVVYAGSATRTLTLDALGGITFGINQNISSTGGALNINLYANNVIRLLSNSFVVSGGGNLNVGGAGHNTPYSFKMASTSSITTTGITNTNGGNITITTNSVDAAGSSVDINGDPLDISVTITNLTANGGTAVTSGNNSEIGKNGGTITLSAAGAVNINGNLTANGSNGSLVDGASGDYGVIGGNGGSITVASSSGDITVTSTLSTIGGNGGGDSATGIMADPADGGDGGDIQLTALSGAVSVNGISTRGGAAIGAAASVDPGPITGGVSAGSYAQSGDAGDITLNASGGIALNGNLDSRAGNLPSQGSAGAGGAISIQGNAVLANNINLNSNVGNGNQATDGSDGSVTFTGSLNSTTAHSETLTINTGSATFQGAVGGSTALGTLSITATGAVNAASNAITARSINVSQSSSFNSGAIDSSGADDTNGGAVSINSINAISIASIDSRGGTATGDSAGRDGGDITLAAQDITVGTVTTNGSDASGIADNNGGDGGTMSLTATHNDGTPSINLNGDIDTRGGAVTANGSVGGSGTKTISVNGSGSAAGQINIGYVGTFVDTLTVTGNTGTDTLTGAAQTNSWTISDVGDGTLNSQLTFTDFENLIGNTSNDNFVFSASGSMVSINGGSGTGTDSITGRNVENRWTLTAANEGYLDRITGGTSHGYLGTFSDIETLNGNLATDTLQIEGSYNIALSWNITADEGGNLAHTSDGNIGAVSFTEMENLIGSSNVDSFTIANASASIHINGAGSSDSLTASSSGNNTWTIDGSSEQTLVSGATGFGTITFGSIENLVGGTLNDDFDFSGGGSVDSVNGSNGANSITGRNADNDFTLTAANAGSIAQHGGSSYVTSFSNIQTLNGSTNASNTDTLSAFNNDNTWSMGSSSSTISDTSDNSILITFTNMENLLGGTSNDRFDFSAGGSVNSIDGNGGSNTLIGQNALNSWTLTDIQTGHVAISGINYINTFSDIQILQGGSNTDTLTGRNVNNHWIIDSTNGNSVEQDVVTPADRVEFSLMENLVGGINDDRFDFSAGGAISGINGNGGSNTIIGQNALNSWTLSAAHSGRVAISGVDYIDIFIDIQTLQGGSTIDTLTAFNNDNTWSVGSTTSSITDTSDSAALIAFNNIEALVGGSGNDFFDFTAGGSATSVDGNTGSNSITGRNASNEFTLTAANMGSVALSGSNYLGTFSNIQTLNGSTNVSNNDTLTVFDNDNSWLLGSTINSITDTSDNTALIVFTGMETLQGGDGDDHFNFTAGGSASTVNGNGGNNSITGRNASNDFTLNAANTGSIATGGLDYLDTFSNIQTLNGSSNNANADTLTAFNNDHSWIINTAGGGSISDTSDTTTLIIFTNMDNMTGGSNDDAFIVQGTGSLSGDINGGDQISMDSVHYAISNNVQNNWSIISDNAGSVNSGEISFTGIEAIRGSDDDDTFTISSASFIGNINGGNDDNDVDNNDVVDFSGMVSAFTVTMGTYGGFVNIDEFSGNSLHPEYGTLIGANQINNWSITGQNKGTINGFGFTNFANLTGGTDSDTFTIQDTANISSQMVLNGGANTDNAVFDTLIGPDINTIWTIDSTHGNTLTDTDPATKLNIAFSEFESLTAQGGNDSFGFVGSSHVIGTVDAGAGTDNIDLSENTDTVIFNLAGGFDGRINFEQVTGNGANSTIIGANVANNWTIDGVNHGKIGDLTFIGFANITGGTDTDSFEFLSLGNLDGLINGNGNSGSGTELVDLTGKITPVIVQLSDSATPGNGVLEIINIEQVDANTFLTNEIRGSATLANSWSLDGDRTGRLNGVLRFNGFKKVSGAGNVNNTFTLANGATGITISGADGNDTIDNQQTLTTNWSLGNSSSYQGSTNVSDGSGTLSINFSGIESLQGSSDAIDNFHYYAGTAINSVAGGSSGFTDTLQSHLLVTNDWRISGTNSGSVDNLITVFSDIETLIGGAGDDVFHMSSHGAIEGVINGANHSTRDIVDYSGIMDAVTVNLNNVSFLNIEQVKGNNSNSTLIATNANNGWLINGLNTGSLDGFKFIDFNNLTGGSGIDTFSVTKDGSLTGQINAGNGDDVMSIALTPLTNGSIRYIGDSGNDSITVTGNSASASSVAYTLLDSGFEQLVYSDTTTTAYTVTFDQTETVNDQFVASSLRINGSTGNDQIELGDHQFKVNNGADINYRDKSMLIVDADVGSDIINLFEDIDMSGAQVSLTAESITNSNNAILTADGMTLDRVTQVGAENTYLLTDIASLNLVDVTGDVYLSNLHDLALAQFINITGAVNIIAQSGTITNTVDINTNGDLQLTAQNGDINLYNIIHLNTLNINGGNVTIDNGANTLSVDQITASGAVSLTSEGLVLNDNVTGLTMMLNAGNAAATIDGNVNIAGTSSMTATGLTLNGTLSVGGDSVLDAGAGDININATLTATGTANLSLHGNIINQNSAIVSASGNINLSAADSIVMNSAASSTATSGDIHYQANGNISVNSLVAPQGTVSLITPNGAITDNNNNAINVRAEALVIESLSDIGSEAQRFDTQVGSMDILASGAGSIWLNQNGEVEIIRLQATTGTNRIDILSNNDILLNPGSVAVNRDSGEVWMVASQGGGILGNGIYDLNNADITAYHATFLTLSGPFGSTNRPIILNIPESGSALIQATTYGVRFYPETPIDLEKNGLDVGSLGIIQALSGEQLVEIESLGHINPAIFTDLRNYSIAQEPIRLPKDQSYDDEPEEDERVSLAL